MMRAANNAAIRSAIGLGQTDAPTFLSVTAGAGTAAAPSFNFSGDLSTGIYRGASGQIYFASGGVAQAKIDGGVSLYGVKPIRWADTIDASSDLFLFRDGAAGILAQRNGTAKQVHRVYNTFLGTTANEWGGFDWLTTANTLRIGTEHGGTGTARPIDFVTGGVVRMSISAIGEVTFQNALVFGGNGQFRFLSNGVASLTNAAQTDFSRLCLGGNTSAFPAIKRNGTGIDIRLADDSGFAPLTASTVVASTTTIGPAGLNLGNSAGTISLGGTRLDLGTATTTAVQLFSGSTGSPMLLFGGVASAHPAFKRSTTSLQARLADDSAFTNIQGKLTTDTAYTATVVTPTGYITIYDATGTAYRVPATV
jgi:hypothetical protein